MLNIKEYEQNAEGKILSITVQNDDGSIQKFVKECEECKKPEPKIEVKAEAEPKKAKK